MTSVQETKSEKLHKTSTTTIDYSMPNITVTLAVILYLLSNTLFFQVMVM